MIIDFVRHGESIANIRQYTASEHTPLSLKGCKQILDLKNKIQINDYDKIYSSPSLRTRQSSGILLGELLGTLKFDSHIVLDKNLRFRDRGLLTGKQSTERINFINLDIKKRSEVEKTLKIESNKSYHLRIRTFIDDICRPENSANKILVVTHKGYIKALFEILQLNPPEIQNGSITRLILDT